ncbi:MAG TPA: energy transducer TonB [Terracidiphilus sp.]|nr:energy transducer TonB [Terracidiphilus sp.]
MRTVFYILFALMAALPAGAKSSDKSQNDLPKDPRALLAAAAPYYDFSSPELKPWHLKATYQLFDESGKPTEQGTFEYWWASPTVNHATWKRKDASESDWTTDKGVFTEIETGDGADYYEHALARELLAPLPNANEYAIANAGLKTQHLKKNNADIECVMVVPRKVGYDFLIPISMGLFPTYCLEPRLDLLLASYSAGGLTVNFPQVVRTQGLYLAKQIELTERGRMVLTAAVVQVDAVSASDAAFTPPADARLVVPAENLGKSSRELPKSGRSVSLGAGVAAGMLVHQVIPVYPPDARRANVQGTVVLDATIGKDGAVHDLRTVSTPSVLLLESAMFAVSQWTYRPYLLNGKPVQVKTTINVIFTLSR